MKNNNTVSVSFMLLGILFCVCLVAANLLETKVVQIWNCLLYTSDAADEL